jgi:hypothetical protein
MAPPTYSDYRGWGYSRSRAFTLAYLATTPVILALFGIAGVIAITAIGWTF